MATQFEHTHSSVYYYYEQFNTRELQNRQSNTGYILIVSEYFSLKKLLKETEELRKYHR